MAAACCYKYCVDSNVGRHCCIGCDIILIFLGYIKVSAGSYRGALQLGAASFLCGALVYAIDLDMWKILYKKNSSRN